jgi:hypothetical protein
MLPYLVGDALSLALLVVILHYQLNNKMIKSTLTL